MVTGRKHHVVKKIDQGVQKLDQVEEEATEWKDNSKLLRQRVEGGGTFILQAKTDQGAVFVPASEEHRGILSRATAYLEATYANNIPPRPRPDVRNVSAKRNQWVMTEAGVAEYEREGKFVREALWIPYMTIKAVWIPPEMARLAQIAYELLETTRHPVPQGYGAILTVTRMVTKGIAPYEDDGAKHLFEFGVVFNMAHSQFIIDGIPHAGYGSAIVLDIRQPYALEKSDDPHAEYVVLVRFAEKNRRIFHWANEADWFQEVGRHLSKHAR